MAVLVFVLGAVFASFLSMLITRLEGGLHSHFGLSKVLGFGKYSRSFCDSCKNKLRWWDNIPIISFLLLKGKCRDCHSPIPFWYLLIELVTGSAFVLTYFYWQKSYFGTDIISLVSLAIFLLISLLLVFILFFDAKFQIIFDRAVVGLLLLTLIVKLIFGFSLTDLYSGLGSFLFLFFLFLVTKGKGMGFGDVKFAFFMGLFLGWPRALVAFYLAFLTGALVGVIMILGKKAKLKQKIAFGPFLVLGTFVSWWWGEMIFNLVAKWLNI